MKINITYNNGKSLKEPVLWAVAEEGVLRYCVQKRVHPVFTIPVVIPLKNIKNFTIEK